MWLRLLDHLPAALQGVGLAVAAKYPVLVGDACENQTAKSRLPHNAETGTVHEHSMDP